ncbi:7-cyano-7-deazaguanine synthase QueC [soil metagenome]
MLTHDGHERRAVVLLSGGLDSAVTLAIARAEAYACATLAIDYGQRHRHELSAARRVSAALGAVTHREVRLDLRAIGGSALTADVDVPKGAPVADTIPITYVPARNMTLLAIALGLAEVLEAQTVFTGVNAVDFSGYPDCRPGFIAAMQHAADVGTRAGVEGRGVRIETPLLEMTKAQIVRRGVELAVDLGMTHSCYDPVQRGDEVLACGQCESCRLRSAGFAAAGVTDPTEYG